MKRTYLLCVLGLLMNVLSAQIKITGEVYDGTLSEPIIGATIIQKYQPTNGTITDIEGRFSLTISDTATVEISYLGFDSEILKLQPGKSNYVINLYENAVQLDNVVVTAFGIEKDKKAAGFSFTEINGEDLNTAKDLNVTSQLVGKVAGLEVTKPSNGPGGSTRINIRGLAQLDGDNKPLIIVDGIIMDNSNFNSAGVFGGRDTGDGLSAINADDIENITVLKGLSATALYGSRGANGALIITTKLGKKSKGIGVEFTSNYVVEQVAILPNYQEEYGQGANGEKPTNQETAYNNWESWGAKLDGVDTPIFNGSSLPYAAVGQDDLRSFYQAGNTWTNNLAISGGTEKLNSRVSVFHTSNEGIIPNSTYLKYGINTNLSYKPIEKLTLSGKVNLITEDAKNRVNLTDTPSNPSKYFTIAPANLPQSVFEQTRDENGDPIYWSNNPFTLSPYWGINENPNNDVKKRVLAFGSAKYELFDWLSAQCRVSTDQSRQEYLNVEVDGTQHNMPGSIFLDTFRVRETNFDFLLSAAKPITENIGLQVNAGATRTNRSQEQNSIRGSEFIETQIAELSNMNIVRDGIITTSQSRINGLFANATVSINNYLYVEGSIRQDYFSVLTNPNLDDNDNTSLYGAGSLSFILSDAIKTKEWLSFAKIRVGYGVTGFGQINPYTQVQTYIASNDPKDQNGVLLPIGNIEDKDGAVNPRLRPSRTTAFEIGADLIFFENRVGLDISYYDQITVDHIFGNPLPASSGYNKFTLNAGEVSNKGVELLLNLTPIKKESFTWRTSFNFAKNINRVVKLNEGIDQLNFGPDRTFSANIVAQVDGNIGDIWGNVYDRNEQGDIIHDDAGLPQIAAEREILGNFNPDWYGGITNIFSCKNFTFSFLIDTKQGGEILSTTSSFGYLFGRHIKSLPGRENADFEITGVGVSSDGETPNTTAARLDDYYERISSISEENVYDATYVKLRQMTFGYNFSARQLEKLKFIKGLNLSLVGRNLFFFSNGLDELGLDPESIYSASTDNLGLEYASLPSTRSFGFNLNVKF